MKKLILSICCILAVVMLAISVASCKKTYTVTFKDGETVLKIEEVKKGDSAIGLTPEKVGYTFTGWDKAFDNVTSDLTVNAQFTINTYTVTFKDGDTVLKTETVNYGESAVGLTPEKVGYKFTGWDKEINNVTSDLVVNANFSISTYTVTFKDGETVLKTETVNYGESAVGLTPEKVGYKFTGWDKEINNVTSDLVVNAVFTVNAYTVTFKDGETVLKTETVNYGESAVGLTPEKVGYTFTGWDKAFDNVTSDLVVNANFTINTYTVTFTDGDTVLKTETVNYGEAAVAPTPNKDGYTFIGWDKTFENVTSDLVVNANFTINTYTVTFYVDGEVHATKTVEHGKNAVAPTRPKKTGYEFVGWDISYKNVTCDLDVNAVFEKCEYEVVFYDFSGNVIKTETVKYQEAATAPEVISDEYYEFTGWDKEFSSVTKDLEVRAVGNKIKGKIEYYFGEEKLDLTPISYTFGETTTLPTPEKAGYYFVGWFLNEISLTQYTEIDADATGDYKLQARFVETEKQNLIKLEETEYHFTSIKSTLHSSGNFYVFQPVLPSGVEASVTKYNWSTSDSTIATVSAYSSITINSAGYCILTATNKENPAIIINAVIKTTVDNITVVTEAEANVIELCDVTFVGKDGETIGTTKCHKGGSVIYPAAPYYEGYKFIGWDKLNYNITEDTTITGQYEFGANRFNGKSFSIIGDSISTYLNYIPDGFKHFYPYPTADVSDVNMTWWMQVINKMGGTLFANNSYSGSCVSGSATSATKYMDRLEYTQINGETPDVILVYMGSNDCASGNITAQMFEKDYAIMIENLQKLCPDSEIILMTLLTSPFYDAADQQEYNEIIKAKAEQFNLQVLDCSQASLAGHLVDSAHPKYSGMQVFANKVIEELNKIA